jgi:hypothetical protein
MVFFKILQSKNIWAYYVATNLKLGMDHTEILTEVLNISYYEVM